MILHVNRKEMLSIAQKVSKASVSSSCPIEVLKGILLEADKDTGFVTLTATNFEASIRASLPAVIEESGSAVIDSKLFLGMFSLLNSEIVTVSEEKPFVLKVAGGKAIYTIKVLDSKGYPKPEIPFPEDTVCVSGVKSIAKCISFTQKEGQNVAMQCVRLSLRSDGLYAEACDGSRLINISGDKECIGQMEILMPASCLRLLSAISNNTAIYQMGITNNTVVFWDGTLLFSSKLIRGSFLNSDMILSKFEAKYNIKVDSTELYNAVAPLVSLLDEQDPLAIKILENGISLFSVSQKQNSQVYVNAVTDTIPENPFYYNNRKLYETLRQFKGTVQIGFSSKSEMLVQSNSIRCYLLGMHVPATMKRDDKINPKKKAA